MTEQEKQDLQLGALFQLIGNIVIRWNSIDWLIATYLAREQNKPPTIQQIDAIFRNQTSEQKTTAFLAAIQKNNHLFMPINDLENTLIRMRRIRNSFGHCIGGINADKSYGIFDSRNRTVVDVNALYQEFRSLYIPIENGISNLIS